MGSGKLLKRAQKKYGIENFTKEILFVFDSEEVMNAKEKELVTEEFCLREDTYNICVGGKGGFSYINSITRTDPSSEMEIRRVANMRRTHKEKDIKPPVTVWTEEKRAKNSKILKTLYAQGKKRNYFKESNPMSDPELRAKHLESVKGNSKGSKNSQFGTFWITNGLVNKKLKAVDTIPNGWYKGRTLRST